MITQVVNCYLAASAQTGLATRYRINISAVQTGGNHATLQEVEMAATVGGADLCTGGTPTASVSGGVNTPDRAFDDNTSTSWSTGTGTMPQWLEYQFASAVTIAEVRLRCNAIGDAPTDFTIEYHDGSTWQVLKTVVGAGWGGTGQVRSFPIGGKSYEQWRLQGITTQSAGAWVQASELEFRASSGGADECSGGFSRANAGGASGAFDNNTGTVWQSTSTSNPLAQWIEYHLPATKDIVQISYRNSATAGDSWTSFKVQVHDSDSLIDVWTISSTGTWSASETKVFTDPGASVSFSVSPTVSTNSGYFAQGDTATVSYTHNGLSTTIRWLRNGSAISGATSASYTYQAADVGTTVQAEVTAHRISQSVTQTSAGNAIGTPTYSLDTRVTSSGDRRVTSTGDVRIVNTRLT